MTCNFDLLAYTALLHFIKME